MVASSSTVRKMGVLEISLGKELSVNFPIETKLEELIPAAMVKCGLTRVQLLLCLQQSLMNGFSWDGISWAIVIRKHM